MIRSFARVGYLRHCRVTGLLLFFDLGDDLVDAARHHPRHHPDKWHPEA
jgi:hypothetical protein